MSSGERPIGAAKGKQSDTEALCQPPPPAASGCMDPQQRWRGPPGICQGEHTPLATKCTKCLEVWCVALGDPLTHKMAPTPPCPSSRPAPPPKINLDRQAGHAKGMAFDTGHTHGNQTGGGGGNNCPCPLIPSP